jgi:uncharacterized protein YeaC (DUF1315 family)
MKNINKNIRLELADAGALCNEANIDFVLIWDEFIAEHFKSLATEAKKWVTARLPKTKSEIAATVKKYITLAKALQMVETGKNTAKHAADQRQKQTTMEATLVKQRKDVRDAEKTANNLKKQRAVKPKPKGIKKKLTDAKKVLQKAKKEVAKTQREIQELYTFSVNLLVKDLGKNNQRVTDLEENLAALKLTPP